MAKAQDFEAATKVLNRAKEYLDDGEGKKARTQIRSAKRKFDTILKDVTKIADAPAFMAIGFIWMLFHVILLLGVAKLIKAPFFFVAVGSKANIGGAASAPVVAAAFHPALAPVGVLLAVLGYALGTYGAILCAQMMAAVG